ncbi:hypothetical protein LINPERPRIM_LOCUS38200 [Linum perenne]
MDILAVPTPRKRVSMDVREVETNRIAPGRSSSWQKRKRLDSGSAKFRGNRRVSTMKEMTMDVGPSRWPELQMTTTLFFNIFCSQSSSFLLLDVQVVFPPILSPGNGNLFFFSSSRRSMG